MSGRYISLFSGIGGLDIAVEAFFGYEPAGFVEWDQSCQRVIARHWPGVAVYDDVSTYRPSAAVELVCGGFPCQPASVAGRRRGADDERWLWPDFARIVGDIRPSVVVVENVPGLLTVDGGRAFGQVIGDLAALGYDAEWTSLCASDVGAPHRRQRVFVVATHADDPRLQGLAWDGAAIGEPGRIKEGSHGPASSEGVRPSSRRDFDWGRFAPAVRRWSELMGTPPYPLTDDGTYSPDLAEWMMGFPAGWNEGESRTNRLKQLGNAVVWQQAYRALELLTARR